MLKLSAISKTYGSGEAARPVLKGLNLTVSNGARIAIMGPSGAGKTTFLNICGAMDRPDEGEVLINEKPLPWNDAEALALHRNRKIGFVFQEHFLLPTLTTLENIMVPALVKGRSTDEDYQRAMFLLEEMGLADRQGAFPGQLSGGENQRIAVARALINTPQILLCDEPTGSLDEQNSGKLGELLLKMSSIDNTTLILVSHSRQIASMMDRIYELKGGCLQESSSI